MDEATNGGADVVRVCCVMNDEEKDLGAPSPSASFEESSHLLDLKHTVSVQWIFHEEQSAFNSLRSLCEYERCVAGGLGAMYRSLTRWSRRFLAKRKCNRARLLRVARLEFVSRSDVYTEEVESRFALSVDQVLQFESLLRLACARSETKIRWSLTRASLHSQHALFLYNIRYSSSEVSIFQLAHLEERHCRSVIESEYLAVWRGIVAALCVIGLPNEEAAQRMAVVSAADAEGAVVHERCRHLLRYHWRREAEFAEALARQHIERHCDLETRRVFSSLLSTTA